MTRRAGVPVARRLLVGASIALGLAAVAMTLAPPAAPAGPRIPSSIAERLGERTWALAIPASWLAAPIPGLRAEDILDVLGARPGERATANEVASGLRVISADERVVVVELTADDASAIASARARGLTLVPILRSSR